MTISLNGCRAKVARAKEHKEILKDYLRETFSTDKNRIGVGVRFDANTSEHVTYISRVPDLGDHFEYIALIVGDILQNLRSALDHLAWQLALWHTNGNIKKPRRVQFPIIDNPQDFPKARNDALAEIYPAHQTIIERFQPYKGIDGVLLGLLNGLCTVDKHRLVIPIMIRPADIETGAGVARNLIEVGKFPYTSAVTLMAYPIELGAEIMRVRVAQRMLEPDVEIWGAFTPTIAFSEARPVLDTIDYIASAVIRVICSRATRITNYAPHLARLLPRVTASGRQREVLLTSS